GRGSRQFENGGKKVQPVGYQVYSIHAPLFNARMTDYKRHMACFVKEEPFSCHLMTSQLFTMIAGENDKGVLSHAGRFESIEQLSELTVHIFYKTAIGISVEEP